MSKKIGVMLLVAVMLIGICTAASATLYYTTIRVFRSVREIKI